jgi:hypothetical protein
MAGRNRQLFQRQAENMSASSTYRGHRIVALAGGPWLYADTRQPVQANPCRDCGHCGKPPTAEGHDACLGTLHGVTNACCGHGDEREAYVQFADGRVLRNGDATAYFASLKQ